MSKTKKVFPDADWAITDQVLNAVVTIIKRNRGTIPLPVEPAEVYKGMFDPCVNEALKTAEDWAKRIEVRNYTSLFTEVKNRVPCVVGGRDVLNGAHFYIMLPTPRPIPSDGRSLVLMGSHPHYQQVIRWLIEVVAAEAKIDAAIQGVRFVQAWMDKKSVTDSSMRMLWPQYAAVSKSFGIPDNRRGPVPKLPSNCELEISKINALLTGGILLPETSPWSSWVLAT